MTIEDLRKKLIAEAEAAFFIGGFGGAILERDEIEKADDDELIEIARRKGYIVTVEDKAKQKTK